MGFSRLKLKKFLIFFLENFFLIFPAETYQPPNLKFALFLKKKVIFTFRDDC